MTMDNLPPGYRFKHLGVAVPDLMGALSDYKNLFGYHLLSGPFDDAIQRVTVCFIGRHSAGDPALELIAPLGEGSPVRRLLSQGGGAYHICYEVDDIAAAIAELRAKRCLLVSGPAPAVAFGGRPIAWFYTPSGQLVEIVERSER
jgi:methylmalonyl-CoA/ethylmalonyl-CoA epimerase